MGAQGGRHSGAQRGALALRLLVGLVVLATSCPHTAHADFFNQDFANPCKPVPDPPPSPGFLRWSSKSTWTKLLGRKVSVIPGVGAKGALANVTIPCGRAVLLDVPSLSLTYLDIRGLLKVEDVFPRKRVYRVFTSFVSVEGQLTIGSSKQHFRNRIIFTLMPNRKARLPLLVKGTAYPDKAKRQKLVSSVANVGHKAFAVVGGQLRLYGMPGGGQTPSWVRLSATAYEGTNKLRVVGDVSKSWFVGAAIAVASTDFHYDHAEEFRIRGLRRLSPWETQITLDRKLKWRHMGVRVADGMGGTVDERAEVALLSRNIMITGLVEGGDLRYEGGHFIVHQTSAPQIIEGVEFFRLGQQGNLGRYSIHFHVCADVRRRSRVYKNSVHDSNQRCVVVHATHNLIVDSNVAYNTSGHCFLVEEGGEQDNLFRNNLGFLTVAVDRRISTQESDHDPSTFWISNIKNDYIGNVAAGSASSGFWTELKGNVRGMSRFIPELAKLQPLYFGPGGKVDQNVLHSNWLFGFRTYPHGIRALGDGYYPGVGSGGTDLVRVNYTITRLLAYKHRRMGVFIQASGAVIIRRSSFADNNQGVYIQSDTSGVVEDSRFVGVTSNIGTPPSLYTCKREYGPRYCAPIKGCQFPPTDPSNTRSLPGISWQQPIFGILTSGISYLLQSSPNAQMARNRFSGYDASCRPAAGVGFGMWLAADWWDAAVALQGAKAAVKTPPVWFPPPVFVDPVSKDAWYAGEALTRDLVLRDTTGGVVGGTGGYIVANDSFLLPPSLPGKPSGCKALRKSNAFACPGTCYRTVKISYKDYGFEPYPTRGNFKRKLPGDYSYLVLQRNQDKRQRRTDGNLQISYGNGGKGPARWFYLSLLSGATYDVTIKAGRNNASFWPDSVTVSYADGFGKDQPCRGAVSLRFMPKGMGRQWVANNDKGVFWSPCPGLSYPGNSRAWPVYYHYACYNNMRTLLMRLNSNFKPGNEIILRPTGGAVLRCKGTNTRCGVVRDEDWYSFDDRGLELHSKNPKVPGFQSLLYKPKGWKYGKAIIGFVQYFGPTLGTKAAQGGDDSGVTRNTFYFRRSFTVSTNKLWCYSGIEIQYYPIDGIVAYLNGAEVFRFGLPSGRINASTYATSDTSYDAYASFATKTVPLLTSGSKKNPLRLPRLRKGTNLLAFEVHLHNSRDFSWYFDSTTALIYRC